MKDNEYTFVACVGGEPIQMIPGELEGPVSAWTPQSEDETGNCPCPRRNFGGFSRQPRPWYDKEWSFSGTIAGGDGSDCWGTGVWGPLQSAARLVYSKVNDDHIGWLFSGVGSSPTGLVTGIWWLGPTFADHTSYVKDMSKEPPPPFANPCSDKLANTREKVPYAIQNPDMGVGANCTYRRSLLYVGPHYPATGVSGVMWTGWCSDQHRGFGAQNNIVYEGTECANPPGPPVSLFGCIQYDPENPNNSETMGVTEFSYVDTQRLSACDCRQRYLYNGSGIEKPPHPFGIIEGRPVTAGRMNELQPSMQWQSWSQMNGPNEHLNILVPTFHTGLSGCNFDTSKFYAITATGGEMFSGDNTPPYWSDASCDWMYAIREITYEKCSGYSAGARPVAGGCPTGATLEIGETDLLIAMGEDQWHLGCCLGALTGNDPSDPTYCDALQARGSQYTFNDYVCYGSGTGEVADASGQNWLVDQYPEFSGGPPCSWLYDLQYYNLDIPGPSGLLQTGIAEIAITTGCSESYPY